MFEEGFNAKHFSLVSENNELAVTGFTKNEVNRLNIFKALHFIT